MKTLQDYGIKELRDGLTLERLEKDFNWILEADIEYAFIGISEDNKIIWYNGLWYNGLWHDGIWYYGIWYGGTWNCGTWLNGTWYGGHWHNGIWEDGIWYGGKRYNK